MGLLGSSGKQIMTATSKALNIHIRLSAHTWPG